MEVIWRFIWRLYGDYMIRGSMVIVYLDLPKCVRAIWGLARELQYAPRSQHRFMGYMGSHSPQQSTDA